METYKAKSELRDTIRHNGNFENALLDTNVEISVIVGTVGKDRGKYHGAYFFREDAEIRAANSDRVVTKPVNAFTYGINFDMICAELRNNFI